MNTVAPRNHDIVLHETHEGGWSVTQDGEERLAAGAGLHLTDYDRALEMGDDVASFDHVDLWKYANGEYTLVKSYRH